MRILAVIPARGGSKRLPGKNLCKVGDLTLIQRCKDATNGIFEIQDIILSSDSNEIIKHANEIGLLTPWARPDYLSNDTAKSSDVVVHALNWYESEISKVDAVLLLQPTSPFRKKHSIKTGIEIMQNEVCDSVVSVSMTHSHPEWSFKRDGQYLKSFIEGNGINTRSQDLVPAYTVNGNYYLIKPDVLREKNSFFTNKTIPYITKSSIEALDIDTEDDLEIANYYLNSGKWASEERN